MATKADWKRSVKKWLSIYNLENHTIAFEFHEKGIMDNGAQTTSSHALEDGDKMMTVVTTSIPIYKTHYLDINLEWLRITSLKDLDETICHEFLHILYSPLITFVQSILEREVDEKQIQIYHEWLRDVNETITTDVSRSISDLSNE